MTVQPTLHMSDAAQTPDISITYYYNVYMFPLENKTIISMLKEEELDYNVCSEVVRRLTK